MTSIPFTCTITKHAHGWSLLSVNDAHPLCSSSSGARSLALILMDIARMGDQSARLVVNGERKDRSWALGVWNAHAARRTRSRNAITSHNLATASDSIREKLARVVLNP